MFEYKGKEEFDIGSDMGEFEYDFFIINGEDDFWILINHYCNLYKNLNFFLEGYEVYENNKKLSPYVQVKMKEHNANICITFMEDECIDNKAIIKTMIVNELKSETRYLLLLFNERFVIHTINYS